MSLRLSSGELLPRLQHLLRLPIRHILACWSEWLFLLRCRQVCVVGRLVRLLGMLIGAIPRSRGVGRLHSLCSGEVQCGDWARFGVHSELRLRDVLGCWSVGLHSLQRRLVPGQHVVVLVHCVSRGILRRCQRLAILHELLCGPLFGDDRRLGVVYLSQLQSRDILGCRGVVVHELLHRDVPGFDGAVVVLVLRRGLLLRFFGAFGLRFLPLLGWKVLERGGKLVFVVRLRPVRFRNSIHLMHRLRHRSVSDGLRLNKLRRVCRGNVQLGDGEDHGVH